LPRNLINLERVRKSFGTRALLDGVSLGVAADDRIGIVGRNGAGKTTLLEVLSGTQPADTGRVTRAGGLTIGALAQYDDLDHTRSVREIVIGSQAAHEWAGDAGVRQVLAGLFGGLDLPALPAGLDSRIGALSGGERRRVATARLLVADPELLVLDEPTNHLDVEGVDWLATHLGARRGALLVVTHDRWFLDAVCSRIWEVVDGQVHEYDGGYSAYVLARAERERVAAADEARRSNLVRKELAWLRRGPPARTSKPRFRIEAANALIAAEPLARDSVQLQEFASARLGRTVYELHDVTLRVGDRDLVDRLTWDIGPGDRVAVVGVNGAGKTSLLRLLAGQLKPVAGRLVVGQTVRSAYLSQEVSELPPAIRVLEAVESVRRVVELGKGRQVTATQLCERFGFSGDRQWTPVGDLSGGERRRLQLLRLLMGEPNVLLLDEPTNDLDIDTLTALEDLLDDWPGTLVVVSHDRYFAERVCDRTVGLLGDGRVRDLPAGVDEYVRLRRELAAAVPPPAVRRPAGDTRALGKELARLERRMERLRTEEAALHDQLATHATEHERVMELDHRLRALVAERSAVEDEWLALAEQTE
jgi:ATP-binding cassette subfamily F protein uup